MVAIRASFLEFLVAQAKTKWLSVSTNWLGQLSVNSWLRGALLPILTENSQDQ